MSSPEIERGNDASEFKCVLYLVEVHVHDVLYHCRTLMYSLALTKNDKVFGDYKCHVMKKVFSYIDFFKAVLQLITQKHEK